MPTPRRLGTADLRRHTLRSLTAAEENRSKLPPSVLALEGYSSPTVRHFLNNLGSLPSANYLEVGTWKGSTLISASYGNPGRFTAVDNFSHFVSSSGEGRQAREQLRRVRRRFARWCRVRFHDSDCWAPALLGRLPREVNVYFYDGSHNSEDQYRAFTHFDPVFAPFYVAVVDDWNRRNVREATRAAIADLRHTALWERELFTTGWFRQQATGEWPKVHWFNGLFVAVMRKPRRPAKPA